MRTEDIVRAAAREVAAAGIEPVFARRLSALDRAPEGGAVVRPGPLRVIAAYINGASDVELPVRVIVKRRSAARAMAEAEDAADALSLVRVEGEDGEAVITCDAERAQELELSDADWSVWEADAVASFRIQPREEETR